MVSGTALFLGLFNNLAIFIILVAVYGILNRYLDQTGMLTRQAVFGLSFGLFAIGCMYVKIPVADGVIVDQRNAIVALSGAFGGPLTAVLCAAIAAAYRVHLGGGGALAGVVGVCLAAGAGVGLFKLRKYMDTYLKAAIGAAVATLIILPGFLFVGDLRTGWRLMQAMALPYGSAIFLGIFLVGLLLAHEEYRYTAEVARKRSEERFRELFENLIDVSYRTDRDGNFILISPSSEKLFGYRPEEVLGKRIANFYKIPSRRDEFIAQIMKDGRVQNFEAEIRRKDGSFVWVSTNAKSLTDNDGAFVGIEGLTRDISLLKKAEQEKKKLEETLRQSQKMEAMGTLAGGIAHDFNNILAAVVGYAEMAHIEISNHSPAKRYLQEILNAARRAKELVNHILAFSRKSEVIYIPVKMHSIIGEALKLLRASLPSSIEIRQNIDPRCGAIVADPTALHQVVMNLCTNAAHEMETEGGILSIGLERLHLSEDDVQNKPDLGPGPYLKLSVSDTGKGIAQDDMDRIFNPYFTTKEVGKGSGLGLAVVHGIVKRHNGFVTVESKLNQGTSFHVYLPATTVVEPQVETDSGPLPGGNERILVIDDETAVADVTKMRLEQLGYHVTSLNSSLEALKLFRQQPDAFDLILTDQTMPGMTGERLAKEILEVNADTQIILCTGYSSVVDAATSEAIGIRDFIIKPIDQTKLALTVRNVIDSKSNG